MTKLLLLGVLLLFPCIILGPLGKIVIADGINIYPNDFVVLFISFFLVFRLKWLVREIATQSIYQLFYLFNIIALFSLLFSTFPLNISEKLVSSLYLVRFVLYFNIFIAVRLLIQGNVINSRNIGKLLGFTGISLSLVGWVQYLFYPDLRNLIYLGWDPHDRRIFGTYFDPNFFGLMIVMTMIMVNRYLNIIVRIPAIIFSFITLAFTYSRGSYLAFMVSAIFYSHQVKNLTAFLSIGIILIFFIFLLPKPINNAGVDLVRIFSLNERLSNWKFALGLSMDYPVLGVGFNTIKYVKSEMGIVGTGFDNHSAAGIDNSFLFVMATTGFVGLAAFCSFVVSLFQHLTLTGKTTLLSVCIHSLFTNSLFFPFAMIWLFLVCAVEFKRESA